MKGGTGECAGDTLAEGIAVKEPGALTRQWIAERVNDILLVSEPQLERAVSLLLQIEKTVVEGAGAAGLAAVLDAPERFKGKNVGLVLCGGNIDTRLLANVLIRDLARSGQLSRLRITLQDRPGALFRVMRIFDAHRVNIIEIYHQRIFTNLPAKGLITDIECEARDKPQLDALISELLDEGYAVHRVEMDRATRAPNYRPRRFNLAPKRGKSAFHEESLRLDSSFTRMSLSLARTIIPRERTGTLPPLFPDQPRAVPLSSRAHRAEGVHRTQRHARR